MCNTVDVLITQNRNGVKNVTDCQHEAAIWQLAATKKDHFANERNLSRTIIKLQSCKLKKIGILELQIFSEYVCEDLCGLGFKRASGGQGLFVCRRKKMAMVMVVVVFMVMVKM